MDFQVLLQEGKCLFLSQNKKKCELKIYNSSQILQKVEMKGQMVETQNYRQVNAENHSLQRAEANSWVRCEGRET
jgi:ribosomal protein S24E